MWRPIEDLPDDWKSLASSELRSLASIWREQSTRLRKSDAWRHFSDRLRREWAIETGIIENLYTIDRGITEVLIEKGIEASLIPYGSTDQPVEQIVPILKDQEHALDGVFEFVASRRQLSTSYIKELHQLLTLHQNLVQAKDQFGTDLDIPILRGDWKRLPNNPHRPNGHVHKYCPPEHVAAEMDRLLAMHTSHVREKVAPEIEAAWLHHRFTQIHTFQDGNGRVARALASLVLLRAEWFPLVINRNVRVDYIAALETADKGTLAVLIELVAKNQKSFFIRALSLSEDVLREHDSIEQVISSAAHKIKEKEAAKVRKGEEDVKRLSVSMEGRVNQKLLETSEKLKQSLSHVHGFRATVDRSNESTDFWFKKQIVEMANKFGYYADTRSYRAWVRLRIWEQRQTQIVFSFHSLGVFPVGVITVSAFLEHRDTAESGTTVEGPFPACKDIFQFSYHDNNEDVLRRFDRWLNESALLGLDQWRRQL